MKDLTFGLEYYELSIMCFMMNFCLAIHGPHHELDKNKTSETAAIFYTNDSAPFQFRAPAAFNCSSHDKIDAAIIMLWIMPAVVIQTLTD